VSGVRTYGAAKRKLDVGGHDAVREEERRASGRSTGGKIGVEGRCEPESGRRQEVARQRIAGYGTAGLARRGGNQSVALKASQEPPGHD
jgi:hypothetical protein